MKKAWMVVVLLMVLFVDANAKTLDFVHVRVVDVGPGLCCLIELPDGVFMVYDMGVTTLISGNYTTSDRDMAFEAIKTNLQEIIPENEVIELIVISHQHTDHVSAISTLFEPGYNHTFNRLLMNAHPWLASTTDRQFNNFPDFIDLEEFIENDSYDGVYIIDSENNVEEINHGDVISDMPNGLTLTLLSGYGELMWDMPADKPNHSSNVLRLDYAGKSILFTGDTDGCNESLPTCYRAEREMVMQHYADNDFSLDSDVIIAPHHGSATSSSFAFIQAVSPDYVIFSSGHKHDHPTASTAQRYLEHLDAKDLDITHIFRTDLGDDERIDDPNNFSKEWNYLRDTEYHDYPGDDNIDIWIYENGYLSVNYVFSEQ